MPLIARILPAILLSGSMAGCAIVHSAGFSESSYSQNAPDSLVLSTASRPGRYGIDLVFLLHAEWATLPSDLVLSGWDAEGRFRNLHVSEIALEYDDGTSIRLDDGWEAEFVDASRISGQTVDLRMSDLSWRHEDLAVTLKGHVERYDGVCEEIVVTRHLTAESDTTIGTWFDWVRAH